MEISQKAQSPQHFHVDTYVLYIFVAEEKGDKKREIRSFINKIPKDTIVVSSPAIGELFLILESEPEKIREAGENIANYLGTKMMKFCNFQYQNSKIDVFETVTQLRKIDNRLDHADALILSCAITDPCAIKFYTSDTKMVGNIPLSNAVNEIRKDKHYPQLKIEPLPGTYHK